ncbi:nucleotide-binding protein [Candidatus Micrarchaeota archaeon]|nr:nucleotide-binding protein [Candidatus Micrarchaeota archaeon]
MNGKKVVLDTNFLLVPHQFRIDVFGEIDGLLEFPHTYVIPSGVKRELEKLAEGRGDEGAAARLGLKMLRAKGCTEVESRGNVDNWIRKYAKKENAIVATNDRELRNKLKKDGVKVVILQSKSRLGIV